MPLCTNGRRQYRSAVKRPYSNTSKYASTQPSNKNRCSTRRRNIGHVLDTRRWLEKLPIELFDLIFRHVSGTAAVDNYLCRTAWYSSGLFLKELWQLLLERNTEMMYVCRQWRKLLSPTFYRYCVYDCGIDAPLVSEEQICHIRKVLVYIPTSYCSYRNVARGLFRLPMDVRKRVYWLGVCMNNAATISMSEMGALAQAFPNLQHVWVDLATLNTKLRDVYPVLMGTATPARITTFVCRDYGLINQKIAAALIRRTAASLEYLDLGIIPMMAAYKIFWGGINTADFSRFPRLRTLRIIINDLSTIAVAENSQGCTFPMLKELTCHVIKRTSNRENTYNIYGQFAKKLENFLTRLITNCPSSLKYLNISDFNGMTLRQQTSRLYSLEHIVLQQYDERENDEIYDYNNLSETLQLVRYIPMLRSLTIKANWYMQQNFKPNGLVHGQLSMLDVSNSKLTMCNMQQLLTKFPNLQEIRLTLLNTQDYLPPDEINYNLSLRRLWINACTEDLPMWNAESLESLVILLARMPNLKELLLFQKAVEWLSKAISRKNRDDLLWLSLGVNIGRCNYDEKAVRHTTTLFL
ncbi:hypothetical protein COEREDRAFT_80813 [Coemansia reversa NRRL 1564]|uniref:Uncharacterized protein n=1 Tax=Coemansia reversa (strain ATCC 12441 / NRRL 1564) TaxID=763665 RepID=A0A2G5BDL0_COERN|nr:hypothetical protein COEREDRAFT_80813 [Coemansia reversa NRRL 1564]|eukprot:PIA17104.1 hypothetical protein COEREDRAFT_80813 [Coemansia reversa NRRL 1564]